MADVDDVELWGPAAREDYAAAADRVRTALDRHSDAINSGHEIEALAATATELEAALAAMSEAEQALTGAAAFWLDTEDTDDPDGGAGDPDSDQPDRSGAGTLSDGIVPVTADLQLTMDVTDADRLFGLARDLDPGATVDSIEDAIFLVTGRLGWDHLLADQVDGVTMQGATARLVTP